MGLRNLVLGTWLILALTVSSNLDFMSATASSPMPGKLELTAVILSPTDLDESGAAAAPIDVVNGTMQSASHAASEDLYPSHLSNAVVHAVFSDVGVQRWYQQMYILTEPDQPNAQIPNARWIIATTFEFSGESDAKEAF